MGSKRTDNLKIDSNKITFIESFESGLSDYPVITILQEERKIVVGGRTGSTYRLQIYDFATHALEYEIQAHEKRILKILPVPSGILSISFDCTLKVYNYNMKLIDGHPIGFMPFDVCETNPGKNFVVVGQSNTVKMLSLPDKSFTDWTTIAEVDEHEGFSTAAFINAKSWIALGLALGHRIYIVSLTSKSVVHKLEGDKNLNGISQLFWLPNATSLIACNETEMITWDMRAEALSISTKYSIPAKKVKRVYALPGSDLFIGTLLESQIIAFRISDGRIVSHLSAKMHEAYDIAVDEKTKTILLTDSSKGTVSILGSLSAAAAVAVKEQKKVSKSNCKCTIF